MASYTYFAVELGDEHRLGCKCCRFSNGSDLPIPKELSNDEIGGLARGFSHKIFKDWTELNAILKRYEDVVQKRWMKKNWKQRRSILLEAWPEMAPTHRPDFVGFRKAFKNTPRSRTMLSKAYLWPYINLEDLVQRHLLLLFINSRGRTLPDKFVSMDLDAAHLGKGWHFGCSETGASLRHKHMKKDGMTIMSMLSENNPRKYGKLVLLNRSESLSQSSFNYHPQIGLLGLEIQQGIYSFLLDCVKLILHDVAPDRFLLAPHKSAPPVPQQKADGYSSFSAHTLEAPYSVPQLLNLDRIKDLVGARRAAAEDHLWLLRDDPGYFLETLKDFKEHDHLTVKHSCSHCWNVVAARMITDAFTYFYMWDYTYRLLGRLPPLEDQIKRADPLSLRLPATEEMIWAELLEVVTLLLQEPIYALRIGVPPSPRLRHCFRPPDGTLPGEAPDYSWHPKGKISDSERRVTGLLLAIVDKEQRDLHSLNHLIQEVQYMMETDPASNELIDTWINSQIADLALLSELKNRILGLQPWQTSWRDHGVQNKRPVSTRVEDLIKTVAVNIREGTLFVCTEYGGFDLLRDPLDGRLDYPITKAYTKANVDQMRRAEKSLAKFWTELDDEVRGLTGSGMVAIMRKRMSLRAKHRTPPWKAPLKPVTLKVKTPLQERSTNVPFPPVVQSVKVDVAPVTPKAKVKTRGTTSSPPTAEPEPATPEPTDIEAPSDAQVASVAVSKRAHKALDALLPAANTSSHQRSEVAWNELLAAMDEIGLQPEKLYGSVWVFKPREDGMCKVDVTRSISFHEPKEVRKGHKIPTNMVRTFGRRLKHAYGWTDGMFHCEGRRVWDERKEIGV